jgi:hypothetical protein
LKYIDREFILTAKGGAPKFELLSDDVDELPSSAVLYDTDDEANDDDNDVAVDNNNKNDEAKEYISMANGDDSFASIDDDVVEQVVANKNNNPSNIDDVESCDEQERKHGDDEKLNGDVNGDACDSFASVEDMPNKATTDDVEDNQQLDVDANETKSDNSAQQRSSLHSTSSSVTTNSNIPLCTLLNNCNL